MKNRNKEIRDKIVQRLSRRIEIEINQDDNSFRFPKLSLSEILVIKKEVQSSKDGIEVFTKDTKGRLIKNGDKIYLIFDE